MYEVDRDLSYWMKNPQANLLTLVPQCTLLGRNSSPSNMTICFNMFLCLS